mgnify:CR=1 FL=1
MKAGDKVTWKSQAGGSWTEKTGTVIREVPSGESAKQYVPDGIKKSHVKFDNVSKNDRVLVAVQNGKDGKITHYYCPRSSVLTVKED